MAELTHDTADDGFHEIQLSGKQLVFLFMATTVVSVAIFLCGVMVGRGVRAERGDDAADAAVVASTPSATPATEEAAGPPAAEPPAPPAEDELSYHKRLQGDTPKEQLKAQPEPPAPVAQAETPKPAPKPPAQPAASVPTSGRSGTWVVQVTALQNRTAAASMVQKLIGKGYPAYLETPAAGAPAIYRVRIGRYGERREAEQTARRLEKEEQFSPVVTR